MDRLPPGPLTTIANGPISVDLAPQAGGRVAQIAHDGVPWLIGYSDEFNSPLAWGSYPMVPWAGRIRRGRFAFDGEQFALPINFGDHAIHGIGFDRAWTIEHHSPTHVALSLDMTSDDRWPFGGRAEQRVEVGPDSLRMVMSVTAGERAMPVTLGWHPWFVKPDRLEFHPSAIYPRDAEGISSLPAQPPPPGPWDDCFVNHEPVVVVRGNERLRLTSDCTDWVVYDEPEHATCVEPQTGPPDGFNLRAVELGPGETSAAWYLMEWLS